MRQVILAVLLLFSAGPVAAQQGAGPVREALRRQVMERFIQNFVQQAGLTEEQRQQFGETAQRHFRQRQEIQQRRGALLRALDEQLRPGVAADPDSVETLLESIVAVGEAMATEARAEQEEYAAFLSPVQRGLLVLHFERFQRQLENIQRRQQRVPGRGA
jgi:Spy/CpxP family protein refolding chaperone